MPIQLDDYLENTWANKKKLQDKLKLTILAAGLGKRMDPLTLHHLPKPMFPLGGIVPLIETWVRKSVGAGITNISMNLCVLKDTIKDYFGNGIIFGAEINYVEEDVPTGTLGGICKQVLGSNSKTVLSNEITPKIDEFKGSTVIAPSGDIITNLSSELLEQMYDIHKQKGAAFTLLLSPVPWERLGEFGTVELASIDKLNGSLSGSGKIVNFIEKDPKSPSNLNNASLYIIEKDLLKALDSLRTEANSNIEEPFYDFGKHVFPAMLNKLKYISLPKDCLLYGVVYDGLWFDVGRKRDYLNVNKSIFNKKINIDLPYQKLPWGYLGSNVVVNFSEITIIPPVVIGNDCIIERGAKLGPYAIIGDDWTIEKDVTIRNSVLWKRYDYFSDKGNKIPARERKLVDRHEVRRGTIINNCIIVGGTIQSDLHETTVDILENGELKFVHIDWVPEGPRV
jgi:NDP-sugar pyrophosphorylase family protein